MKKKPSLGSDKPIPGADLRNTTSASSSSSSKISKNSNIEKLLGKLDLVNDEKFKKDLDALNDLENIEQPLSNYRNKADGDKFSKEAGGSAGSKEENILSRAKTLLNKAKSDNPAGLANPNKYRVKVSKKDPFLTSIGVANEEPVRKVIPKDEDFEVEQQIDDNEILNSLKADYRKNTEDDLAELRRMIKECQKNISSYAGDLYQLKKSAYEANTDALDLGYGVDNEIFYDMDRHFDKHMPGGDSNLLFVKKNKKAPVEAKKEGVEKVSSDKGKVGSGPPKKSVSFTKK